MTKRSQQRWAGFQRKHYDELVRERRPTRFLLSCGYQDRFAPDLLESRPLLKRALSRIFDRLLPTSTDTLLDLGCGTSYYWPLLAERCRTLVGVDLSQQMLEDGRRYHGDDRSRSWACCEVSELPLASGSVDVVLAVDALHHTGDVSLVLAEVRRVLRPGGGLFVAIEPNVRNPVVFMAHLVPGEERGALWPNHPRATRRAIEQCIGEVEQLPLTYISGLRDQRMLRLLEVVEPLFEQRPLSSFSLRRVYRARRST